jgi:hypothetical protein
MWVLGPGPHLGGSAAPRSPTTSPTQYLAERRVCFRKSQGRVCHWAPAPSLSTEPPLFVQTGYSGDLAVPEFAGASLLRQWLPVRHRVVRRVVGEPRRVLLDLGREVPLADLVVVGSRGGTGLKKAGPPEALTHLPAASGIVVSRTCWFATRAGCCLAWRTSGV